jgi:tetratricopeptide (TPR) repeat protein
MTLRIPLVIMLVGLASLYPVQRYIDSTKPPGVITDESLYFSSGKSIKRMTLGMSSLAADIYWIRTVQYFGQKVIDAGGVGADTRNINMKLLAPLLDIVVTLDPHELAPYRFGAIFLPDYDPDAAIDLLQRGIEANPEQWKLHQDLGFIYWHSGQYQKAADVYERGSLVAGAPFLMKDAAGVMRIKGGSREAARSVYSRYLESDDENIRAQAEWRSRQLDALDQIDALNHLVSAYKSQLHSCPPDWRVLARWTTKMGIPLNERLEPLDPAGEPYTLDPSSCQVKFSPGSMLEAR